MLIFFLRQTINKLKDGDEEFKRIGDGYSKLFEAFETTYKHEQELIIETEGLNENLTELNQKVQELFAERETDDSTINKLGLSLDKAHKLADDAHAREQLAQEVIENMRIQVVKLNNELEIKSKMGMDESEE